MDNAFVQAVGDDLKKKLIRHLLPLAAATIDEKMQRFNNIVTLAIEKEDELKTVTNIVERAAFRGTRPCVPRGAAQHNPRTSGPRTFLAGARQDGEEEPTCERTGTTDNFLNGPFLCGAVSHPTGLVQLPTTFIAKHNNNISTAQQDLMAEVIVAMGSVTTDPDPMTAMSIVEQALQQASGTKVPIKCFGCANLPKYDDKACHLWRDCPNKADQEVWKNFQVNLQKFREERQARNAQRGGGFGQASQHNSGSRNHCGGGGTMVNWERQGCPSKHAHDQIKAIVDDGNSMDTRLTLLTTLKQSLDGYEREETELEEKKMPATKKARWKKGAPATHGRSFLMHMTPEEKKAPAHSPRTMLGVPPKKKHNLKIACKLPFITFPIGDGGTSEDTASLTGLLDTGGCCNRGWLQPHKAIAEQFPQLVDEFVDLEEEQCEPINVGGLKEGVTLTHMI